MKNIYHRLLLLIAGSTQKELASQIRYLKIENQILRSKLPTRVQVTPQERNKLVSMILLAGPTPAITPSTELAVVRRGRESALTATTLRAGGLCTIDACS